MPVTHLLQTEIVQSEIVADDNPLITTTNLQDDLNQIRSVIRYILGRNSWLSLGGIKTIDFITNWFNNNVLANGKLNAHSIDYSVVINIESYPAVLRSSNTWIKLEGFSLNINSQNKVLWSGISFTKEDIDSAISQTETIKTTGTRLSNLEYLETSSWHPVIFNGANVKNFLNGTQNLENAVNEIYNFYSQIRNTLGVFTKEIILPMYLHQFINEQERVKNLVNNLSEALPKGVKLSILLNLTKIPNSYINAFQSNPTFLEDFQYYIHCLYFYDPYEAKFCSDLNDENTCTQVSDYQAQTIKKAFIIGLPSNIKNIGVFVRHPINMGKIFDHSFFDIKRRFKDVNFRVITNFFNIYNGPYSEGGDTYNVDVSKFLNRLEKDIGLEVLYLDDLVWLEKYNPSDPITVNGVFAFNNVSVISSLFGGSISYLDKVVQALKASKKKMVLFYDYLDNSLSTFNFSGTSFSFNISEDSLINKYVVFNSLNNIYEEIDEIFYEKVSTLTKNKHYIIVSPGEVLQTQGGVLKEIYVVSDYAANISLKLIKANFGEVSISPSLVLNLNASTRQISIGSSSYSVTYDSTSYNFLKIEISDGDVKIFFNSETTPLHVSSLSLQDKVLVVSLENTDSARQLKLYGIFKR